MRLVFVDTSAIIAAMNSKDKHHDTAKEVFSRLAKERCALVITDFVRAETQGFWWGGLAENLL